MKNDIAVSDLVVIDFKSSVITPEIKAWMETAPVPFAESCSRQVWYGDESSFADFPCKDQQKVSVLTGAQAYASLLKVMSGLASARVGETHVRGQFADGWRTLVSNHPEESQRFQKIYGKLRNDVTFCKDHIFSRIQKIEPWHVARSLSGQKKGDSILILGSLSSMGNLTENVEKLIRVSENLQKKRDGFITITHPDPQVLKKLETEYKCLTGLKRIKTNITFAPFENIQELIDVSDRVYVDMPMGAYPSAEGALVESWRARRNCGSTLTHMKGSPSNRGLSVEPWLGSGLDNYIAPENIREEKIRLDRQNKALIRQSDQIFAMCANARLEDKTPSKELRRNCPDLLGIGTEKIERHLQSVTAYAL